VLQPIDLNLGSNWKELSLVYSAALVIKHDGSLWAWGQNNWGMLGLNDTSERLNPTRVGTDNKWVSVSTFGTLTIAIKLVGSLWVWGGAFADT
jgi:alpha-tubulin suppressor-like RCC1 family protein